MSEIQRHLARIERALKTQDRAVHRALRPGLEEREVRDRTATAGLTLPQEALDLFEWRNGTDLGAGTLGELWLFPGFYLLSCEEAVEMTTNRDYSGDWPERAFPVFASGGGSYKLLCLSREVSGHARVCDDSKDEFEVQAEYASLTALAHTVAECYEQGVFFVEGSHLEADWKRWRAIAAELNPECPVWQTPIEY